MAFLRFQWEIFKDFLSEDITISFIFLLPIAYYLTNVINDGQVDLLFIIVALTLGIVTAHRRGMLEREENRNLLMTFLFEKQKEHELRIEMLLNMLEFLRGHCDLPV